MRRLLLVSFLVVASSHDAGADTLEATRGQDLVETAHTVNVEVRDGLAYYEVRRVFHNRGKRAEEARLRIDLPHGAVATGLRIKGKDRWYDGELMHARKAEELYVELTGMGPSEPKDPALLYWRWTDELALRVFPVFPGKTNTVEYTLTAPTSYEDGTYYFTYGREPEAENLATPVLRMRGRQIAAFEVDGAPARRRIRLRRVRPHPVLAKQGIDDSKVLVRSIDVGGQDGDWDKVEVDVDIRHTWRGDVEVSLVSPAGTLHQLRPHDLRDGDNDIEARYSFDYGDDPNGTWHLLVKDYHPLDGGTLRRWSLGSGQPNARVFKQRTPASIPQPADSQAGVATMGVRFKRGETALRLGRVDLLSDHQFARFEVDVARRLSELPRPLSVSFAIDVSHTMDREGIAAQLDLIDAYLSHVPWARFSLVAFGRHARLLTRGFEPSRKLGAVRKRLLASGNLAPRNGSFLDRGAERAASSLSGVVGSRALVLMTDNRVRPAWTNAAALAHLRALPEEVVVHVVDVSSGGSFELRRDDRHRLFPLARLRGGVAVYASGIRGAKRSDLVGEALYLVRPNRIDHVQVTGLDGYSADSVLPEGTGVRWMGEVERAPRRVAITGQLWSEPYRQDVRSDDEPFNRATAGFVFSHDHHDGLTEAQQLVLAMYARAVTPVTSYLAIEPGVRPSVIGLDEGRGRWGGTIGSGLYGTIGYGMGGSLRIDWQPIVDRVTSACRGQGTGRIEARLHLQDHEIADVDLEHARDREGLGRCVVEALWKESIPRSPAHLASWSKLLELRFDR